MWNDLGKWRKTTLGYQLDCKSDSAKITPHGIRARASSNALRAALFVLLAFGHNGGAETNAKIVGQFVELGVAINFDGFLGSVANHVAVVAPGEMIFQLDFCFLVEDAVQIIGQLV
jgi:hypothetical protein